ncbi:MAG: GtrA family protein [Ancalomicrobiaceae bacterium]|nr:GtrA family protein [Ancalomicrobiaceae bacterium]
MTVAKRTGAALDRGFRAAIAIVPWKLVRYGVVGVTATGLYFGFAIGLTMLTHMPASVASIGAYLVAAVFSFLSHRHFTFRSRQPIAHEVPRFAGVQIIGWSVAFLSPLIMTDLAGLPPLVAIVFVSLAVPLLSFLGMERLVFRARPPRSTAKGGVAAHGGSDHVSEERIVVD